MFQLPAGSWLVQGNIVLTNTAASSREVTCTLSAAAAVIDTATTDLEAAGGLDTLTVALAGTARAPDPTLASFNCTTSGIPPAGGVDFADGDLIATQVGTLHQVAARP
jgi:hypothetical protein